MTSDQDMHSAMVARDPADPMLARLVEVARHIEWHAEERLTLADLAGRAGISPYQLQRRFKQAFGISPKVYQDAVRLRRFKLGLRQGDGVTDAIFAAGFGSISRIYGEPARNLGMAPRAYRAGGEGEVIAHACRDTVLGTMVMAATDKGVCFVAFGDDEARLTEKLREEFPEARLETSPAQDAPLLDAWIAALDDHLGRGGPRPDLPLDMRGTAFQMAVWRFLLSVPDGEVMSYGDVAAGIGKPRAVRAVASACAANRVGVLIPCHRVLRGDGNLGGYRWGLERKRALLEAERDGGKPPRPLI